MRYGCGMPIEGSMNRIRRGQRWIGCLMKTADGYALSRLPVALTEQMDEGAADVARMCSGVELRFRMKSSKVTLKLRAEANEEAQVAFVYFGSFQGGWQQSSKAVGTQETAIEICRPGNMDILRRIAAEQCPGYDPEVVRIVLSYGKYYYYGIEGKVEAPGPEDYPEKTYLAYGSSITHGSLALAQPYTYVFQIGQKLGCDYLNLGMAGAARLEKVLAEYLTGRKDWDFMSLELGINMLGTYEADIFEERVKAFLEVTARDPRPVFVTSLFGFQGDKQEKGQKYRDIVRKYAKGRFYFADGLELLNEPHFVSQDLTHPSLEGVRAIADRWSAMMCEKLGVRKEKAYENRVL